jgi:DNA-binding LacI/PurR family transcriptional regulator
MAVSIIEVAKRANVSRMTVTRVMRNDSVREETRQRVLQAMRELGYVPSRAAQAMRSSDPLRSSQATCFALVFGVDTQKADDFFCEVTRGIERQASEFGLCALQVHWLEDLESSWLKMQTVLSIDGLCGVLLVGQFSSEDVNAIKKVNSNIVMVDGPVPTGTDVAGVESDNFGGCELALCHLLECNVKKPLILTGPKEHYFSQSMMMALNKYRDKFESVEIINTDYTSDMARKCVNKLIYSKIEFDAVFGNDILCIGAMKALTEHYIKVPEEVKIIGFDNIPVCQYLTSSLSSIHIDKQRLGEEAVKALVDIVRNEKKADNIKLVINAELRKRESTKGGKGK